MTKADLTPLRALLDEASAGLPDVTHRRMFGCDALFADGRIYALVWKEGRIGLRLPDAKKFESLLKLENAAPFCPGARDATHWVLVPTSFHDKARVLTSWVKQAHALARSGVEAPAAATAAKVTELAAKKRAAPRPPPQATRNVALPPPPGGAVPNIPGAVPKEQVAHLSARALAASTRRPTTTASDERPISTAADKRRRTTGSPAPGPSSSPREVHVEQRLGTSTRTTPRRPTTPAPGPRGGRRP